VILKRRGPRYSSRAASMVRVAQAGSVCGVGKIRRSLEVAMQRGGRVIWSRGKGIQSAEAGRIVGRKPKLLANNGSR